MNAIVRSVLSTTTPRFASLRHPGLLLAALLLPALASAQSVYDPYSFSTVAGNSNAGWVDGTGAAAGFDRPMSIVGDAAGNTYVADTGNNIIRMISPDGTVTTVAGLHGVAGTDNGVGSAARFWNPAGIARDAAGNLYVSDTGNHTIRKILMPSRQVVALAGTAGTSGFSDGTGTAASFRLPYGLVATPDGSLYVCDTGNNIIRKIDAAGQVTTLAGIGMGPSADYLNGTGPLARFNGLRSLAVDSAGNVFVADTYNHVIRKITPAGVVTLFAGEPGVRGTSDGSGAAAHFNRPFDVAVDTAGNVYVADYLSSTIRKITPAGLVSTLAGLALTSGSADGTGSAGLFAGPASVAVDSSGTVYVVDSGNSTIRKVTAAGVVTTLAGIAATPGYLDATGTKAQFNSPQGLDLDSSGNVYVADTGNHVIRKVTPDGVVTTLAGSPGTSGLTDGTGSGAQFSSPAGVAVDGSGNMFVADSGYSTVRKVTSAGVVTTYAGTAGIRGHVDGTGAAASFSVISGLALDSAGNLFVADANNNLVRKITKDTAVVTTFAGSVGNVGFEGYTDGDNQDGKVALTKAHFSNPTSIVYRADSLYVTDSGNSAIRRIDLKSEYVITIAGSGWDNTNTVRDGLGLIARFSGPSGMAVDGAGRLFVADTGNDTVRMIVPAGLDANGVSTWTVSTWVGALGRRGMADALAGFTGIFNGPWGLCSDADGNLTIADTYNNAVRRVAAGSTSAGAVTTLAGSGLVNSRGSADGKGTAARFNEPNGLTVDPAGNVYVVDTYNCTIRMVTPAGVATTIAGTAVPTPPGIHADDTGAAAGFVFPTAIVRDRAGNLFVADVTDAAIRKITPDFVVTTFAGTAGTRGGADGTLNVGTLYNPRALAIDPDDDTIYVADSGNSTIRKITAAGAMTTVAGTAGSSGTADGVGTAAQFSTPSGIAVGPGKVLYVVDQGSNTIRKIATDGTVTTIAGSILNRGSRDGTGTDAWFSSPAGIAADTDGNLFVADTGSNLIRKIDTSYKVTTVAGVADKVGGADGTGSAVLFNSPVGIAVGPLNALYVCDTFNNTIRTGVHASGGGATGGVYAFSGATSLALRSDPASNGHGQSFAVVAPTITAQPASLTVSAGDSVNFVVGVTGSTPLAFQWSKNGIKLIGATASTYVLGSAQVSDAGAYSVVVSNAAGTVTSNSATLTVTGGSPAKSGAQLINLSSRTQVGTGANITISGFVVSGAERKSLLIRGIGPALANYGVSGAMATPTLTVFSGSTVLASNDGWKKTDADRIRATAQLLGAFALPEDGRDCAILADFAEGIYTVHLQDKTGATGVGLIELYDANAAGGSKLINLSTRAFVGRDASILITGLVIAGPGPKTMLVRAVGPGLTAYGVDGVLSHPKMVLLSGQQAIASNTGWTTAANRADLVTVAARVGAFPLDANSADSAMLLTLEPGIYTIQVSGASGETGTALVESYEVE